MFTFCLSLITGSRAGGMQAQPPLWGGSRTDTLCRGPSNDPKGIDLSQWMRCLRVQPSMNQVQQGCEAGLGTADEADAL